MNYFHPLIFFYPIHTFNLRVIQGYELGTFSDPISAPAMLLFYGNVLLNFLLAFLSTRLFYVVIKTKDPLSCKNNSIRINDLISKTVAPVLWVLAEDSNFMQISVLVNGIVDCIRRDFSLFWYLPYYSIQILYVSTLTLFYGYSQWWESRPPKYGFGGLSGLKNDFFHARFPC